MKCFNDLSDTKILNVTILYNESLQFNNFVLTGRIHHWDMSAVLPDSRGGPAGDETNGGRRSVSIYRWQHVLITKD